MCCDAGGQGPGGRAVPPAPGAAAVSSHEELRAAGVRQSRLCRDNGSPTYAAIIDALVSRLGDDDPAVTLLRTDPRPPVQSALYLRLLLEEGMPYIRLRPRSLPPPNDEPALPPGDHRFTVASMINRRAG